MEPPLDIARQRCFNHLQREAVARCPECRRFFCRECVTEHQDRVLCAGCLARLTRKQEQRRRALRSVFAGLRAAGGFFLLWFLFYCAGRALLRSPSEFHEGTLWPQAVQSGEGSQ
ncbi:MAG: rhomboid family protein [Kiritimatiellae bacterium]|nr:rhomboid family protein [Kiritimatiellia bacterium]